MNTLAKLISRATLHCRTYPASRWVDVFTPTLPRLGDVCLLVWHSSDLLPPGTFPIFPEKPTLPHTWLLALSHHAEWGYHCPTGLQHASFTRFSMLSWRRGGRIPKYFTKQQMFIFFSQLQWQKTRHINVFTWFYTKKYLVFHYKKMFFNPLRSMPNVWQKKKSRKKNIDRMS